MTSEHTHAEVDLEASLAAALEAADAAQRLFDETGLADGRRASGLRTKRDAADVVTDLDTGTERAVRELLAARLPEHRVIGEEFGGDRDQARDGWPTWWCDPVDGTMNLSHGLPWTSFSLALAVGQTPLVGVVLDPWRRELSYAVARRGARCRVGAADRPLLGPGAEGGSSGADEAGAGLAGALVLTEWANHEPWPGMTAMLASLSKQQCTVRIMGSGTLTLLSVAHRRSAAAVIGDFHPEDHLAASLVVAESGAFVGSPAPPPEGTATTWPEGVVVAAVPGQRANIVRTLSSVD